MHSLFKIEALNTQGLHDAWPLVRSSGVYANEDWWTAEACDVIRGGGGVLVARAADGCVHAVTSFQPVNGESERTLAVKRLITLELTSNEPARTALLGALERIATKLECSYLLLPLAGKHVQTVEPAIASAWNDQIFLDA